MIGRQIAHYRVVERLGAGGMGEVYRAEDTRLGREVAVKLLPAELATDPERLERFRREARTLAALNHPSIVTIYSVESAVPVAGTAPAAVPAPPEAAGGRDGELHFLTMELVEGETLDRHVSSRPVALDRSLALFTPIAEALAAAHERGIVHRDLKPGNVMVSAEGRVKVLDFGLAKAAPGAESAGESALETMAAEDLTAAGAILGTPAYMAPEQLRGEAADGRSDLFALGLMLYEVATGRHPFRRDSPLETASAILRETAPELSVSLPGSPPLLGHLVSKLLAKEPAARYQTARGLLSDLRAIAEGGSSAASEAVRAAPERFSIAVLPFTNMSADPENDFLADGLAEDLINELARIEGIKVVARTSAFQFRGQEVDVREIGARLGVGNVLEGSVRAAGRRLRVNAQVVDVEDGCQVWSERFDREQADIFDIQDEITAAIGERIRATLGERRGLSQIVPAPAAERDPEAHAAFLKGRHRMVTLTSGGLESARAYFEQALAIDPEHAEAHAALSWLAVNRAHFGGGDPKPLYEEARRRARKALAISDAVADAHGGLAFVHMYGDWNWAESERCFRRGIELAPGSALLRLYYACLLSIVGRHEEAVAESRRAQELDPLAGIVNGVVGLTLNGAGRYQEAVRELTRGIGIDPDYWLGYNHRAVSHYALGNDELAAADWLAAWEKSRDPMPLPGLIAAFERAGHAAEAGEWMAVFEGMADSPRMRSFHWAVLELMRGRLDSGFAWLERSLDARDSLVPWIPQWATLRGSAVLADPRFAAARARLGLPPGREV